MIYHNFKRFFCFLQHQSFNSLKRVLSDNLLLSIRQYIIGSLSPQDEPQIGRQLTGVTENTLVAVEKMMNEY